VATKKYTDEELKVRKREQKRRSYYKNHEKELARRKEVRSTPEYKEYMRGYARQHYLKRKARLDELKTGGCSICGYNEHPSCLDFHHLDPSKKEWYSMQLMNRNFDVAKEEIAKCVLVCANCHRLIHAGVLKVP
jgi:hypothetical protein